MGWKMVMQKGREGKAWQGERRGEKGKEQKGRNEERRQRVH